MQRLLNAACWDADAVRDDLCGYVGELRESGDRAVTFLIDAPNLDDLNALECQVSAAIDIIVDPRCPSVGTHGAAAMA